jgi:hypothetical protein
MLIYLLASRGRQLCSSARSQGCLTDGWSSLEGNSWSREQATGGVPLNTIAMLNIAIITVVETSGHCSSSYISLLITYLLILITLNVY